MPTQAPKQSAEPAFPMDSPRRLAFTYAICYAISLASGNNWISSLWVALLFTACAWGLSLMRVAFRTKPEDMTDTE